MVTFMKDTLTLRSFAGAELQKEEARTCQSISSVHILQSRHEKHGVLSLLVQSDVEHVFSVTLPLRDGSSRKRGGD